VGFRGSRGDSRHPTTLRVSRLDATADHLLAVLNAKLRDGAPLAANQVRALVSRIYTFGAEQRLVPPTANPVIGVKKPTKETTRDRVLTEDETRRIWEA
jgi:hypothetical protein